MPSFFRKPFVYTAIFSTVLSLFFLYTILLVFVIPRRADTAGNVPDVETFTGVVDTNWGKTAPFGTPEPPDAEADAEDPFALQPGEAYPVITDNLYLDENIRIEITELRRYDSDMYVADIRLKDPTLLKTALAQDKNGNRFGMNIKEKTSEIAERVGAILAINGDFYGSNESGYVIRNGVLYRDTVRPAADSGSDLAYFDDLAIMWDGSFVTFDEKNYSAQEVKEKGAMHVLTFGPTLVLNGEAGGRVYRIDGKTAVVSQSYGEDRYGVISHVLMKRRYTNIESRVENADFAALGGRCLRVVNVPKSTGYDAMRHEAEYQIKKSMENYSLARITVADAFPVFPGDRVEMESSPLGLSGKFLVTATRCTGSGKGVCTEIEMKII